MESLMFALCAASLLVMAVSVVVAKSPLRSALALIVALVNLAVLFVLLQAPFVASMQVLVYAGAIMVLFLFVIMLLNLRPDAQARPTLATLAQACGCAAGLYLTGRLLLGCLPAAPPGHLPLIDGTVRHIGQLLLHDFLFHFEAISMLLLTAVVGAVTLGLKRSA